MAISPESDRPPDPGSHHWASAGSESRVAGRLASTGLLLVLIVLTGFAVLSAVRTEAAAGVAARSSLLNDAYGQARYAVGAEESLEREYRLEPGPAVRDRFDEATTSFVSAMQLVGRNGTAADRALAADLLARHHGYRQAVRRLFAAVDIGEAVNVLVIDVGEADPRFGAIESLVVDAARKQQHDDLASVRSLERIQRVSLIGTPLVVACGLLLLALFYAVLRRQRRRTDAARWAELVAQTDAATALAASNQRLLALDRQKDEFVASVSHELRTPLTSILGYLDMMVDGEAGELTTEQLKFLATIERNSTRLQSLVGDLLDVAQLETRTPSLDRSSQDLQAIVWDCVASASVVAEARGLALTLVAEEIPELELDPVRVGQVIDNLLSNALKFTPPGGSVEVRLSRVEDRAVVEIVDTGMGMSAAEQEQIFERFYRAESAVKQAIQGTGLGLSISKSIVEAHGGAISVKSSPGVGTTFRVELPLPAPAASVPGEPSLVS